jgi:hypothetical protein
MIKLDVTKTNLAVDRLLQVTTNPRHRFLLQAYHRHRYLEIAGQYEEIFAPDMMVEKAIYHFHFGGMNTRLEGQEAIKNLYRLWTETNQSIFYAESEQVAVADNFIASNAVLYQQVWGRSLTLNKTLSVLPGFLSDRILRKVLATQGLKANANAMYLYKTSIQMFWPYDDRGRLIGEDVWEPDPDKAEIIKLDPADVMTARQAAEKLNPLIKPLPLFDEAVTAQSPPVMHAEREPRIDKGSKRVA